MMAVTGEMFGELVRYRGLLAMLAWRDIRVRYKQSLLGVAWAFLMPLFQTVILFVVFQYGVMGGYVDESSYDGMPYFLFVLTGVIPWTLFNGILASSVESLTRNSRLVTKIYFPREVFPLGTVAGALVDFGVSLLIFIPVYAYYAIHRPLIHAGPALLLIPVVLLVQLLLAAGLALIISMANLFFRDVKYLMTFLLQFWFFATNIMYQIRFERHPALQWLSRANPMIAILNAYRYCLTGHVLRDPAGMAVAAAIAVIVFLGGWRLFHAAEFKFAEYV
jgi:ABC-type polysaccharide/polyol phosphate export permease